ncbi:MAG: matrixin family metalloprotease [Phycisphaerae bacterium]|nr:matrixin family metalloprotease [Gemmatimonadaceae bacterium]
MKYAEVTLSACVVALAAFVGLQARELRVLRAPGLSAAGAPSSVDSTVAVEDAASPDAPFERPAVEVREVMGSEPALEPRELRRRLEQGAYGTYIHDLLRARDSSLARWPVRIAQPLRVWVAEAVALPGWDAQFPSSVRDAFDGWVHAGIPMRFTFTPDSASADVHVRFLPRFPSGISGKTMWSRTNEWWMVSADIVLSLAHPAGGVLTPLQMRAIALHEVGHLLGLDHTEEPTNIMSARVRVRDLSDADRATIRLLYSVPAGTIRSEPADSLNNF